MRKVISWLALLGGVAVGIPAATAATPDQPLEYADGVVEEQFWRIDGGELLLRFNDDLLDLFGISVAWSAEARRANEPGFHAFAVRRGPGLQFNAPQGGFDRFVGGSLQVVGGADLVLPDGQRIALRDFTLRVDHDNPMRLQLVDSGGEPWLYVNHLMYKLIDDERGFFVRSADLRASPALAFRLGAPELADAYVGEIKLASPVVARSAGVASELLCHGGPQFHGMVSAAGMHRADVLMESYSMSFSRCRRSDGLGGCDGAGPDDGEVVFTPSSTLRNSNLPTTADVPWYQKFTTSPYAYPYPGNDQHPYLIWNLYRIADGQLEQIGASGVKHAFLTINTGCAADACTGSGHILGRNCGDTYGTGNNDNSNDLGPRHELIPATGEWGRCGSIFDPDCNGSPNASGNTSYDQRLVVRESQMQVPGAQFFSESWYIVQDDIDIYNTMAHRSMAPVAGGSGWTPGAQGAFLLGPVINSWVDPQAFPARNVGYQSALGNARVAVRVKPLDACPPGSGLSAPCYRWDYAANNFDWTNAQKSGTPPNLRVSDNRGFVRFSLDVGAGAPVYLEPGGHFADIDTDASNDWQAVRNGDRITWQAPAGNSLDWGLLYRFSLVTTLAPDDGYLGTATLDPDDRSLGTAALPIMVPGANSAPIGSSIEDQSDAEGDTVSLPLDGYFSDPDGDPLSYSATGLPPALQIDAVTGLVSGSLDFSAAGIHAVVVTARDPSNAAASQPFTWHVANTNRAPLPVGSVPDQSGVGGQTVLLALAGFFADPDDDLLEYAATGLPEGLQIDPATGAISGTLEASAVGVHAVVVQASDPDGASAEQAFGWTVHELDPHIHRDGFEGEPEPEGS
jgi:hypothetical protein